jgi:hypothetical protein
LATGKLEVVFVDKDGKFYPLDEVNSAELVTVTPEITKIIA